MVTNDNPPVRNAELFEICRFSKFDWSEEDMVGLKGTGCEMRSGGEFRMQNDKGLIGYSLLNSIRYYLDTIY